MKYRQMGRASLNISCIGLGGNIFGYFCDKNETKAILDRALSLGINFVDTADVYSEGLSEVYIGDAIGKKRSQWIIATKIGVRGIESPHVRGKREYITVAIEQSLKRLKTDYIDIYQMHHPDPDTPLDETFSTLQGLVEQGKIRYFGLCNFTASQLQTAYDHASSLKLKNLVSLQMHYNMLKRYVEPEVLDKCRSYGFGLFVFGGLGRGILSGKYKSIRRIPNNSRASVSQSVKNDLTDDMIQTTQRLSNFAHEHNMRPSQLALAWLLSKKEITTIIVGTRNIRQLVENSLSVDRHLEKKDLLEIDRVIGSLKRFDAVSLGSFPLPYLGP